MIAAAFIAATALVAASATMASADIQVCIPGAAAGKCVSPQGLAADFETEALYVADKGNNRVDKFESAGTAQGTPANWPFTSPEHIAVDNEASSASHHDVYLTSGYVVKKYEPNGTLADEFGEEGGHDGTPTNCELERSGDPIAVGPEGEVELADSYDADGAGPGNVFANRIVKFDDEGNCIGGVAIFEGTEQSVRDLAVDSEGNVYVTVAGAGGVIREFDAAGAPVKTFEGLETAGLAVDAADHLFALQSGTRVTKNQFDTFLTEYDSRAAGNGILRRFDYAPGAISGSPGLAALHSSDGDVFRSDPNTGVRYVKEAEPGPVVFPEGCHPKGQIGSDKATLQAEVNPEGKATSFRFEYLTQAKFEAEGDEFKGAESSEVRSLEGAADFEMHEASLKVEELVPETEYRCRVVATNADSGTEGTIGAEGEFETGEPFEFGPAWSAEVGETTAKVNAEGNPLGIAATGQIEYVTDAQYAASGFAEALSAPEAELEYGFGEAMVLKTTTLSGLQPGTLYHYRLRARNAGFPEGIVCPEQKADCPELEHTFRTHSPEPGEYDQRRYELVSPGQKNSAEVATPSEAGGFFEHDRAIATQAASPDGEAATYTSWTSFGQAEGAPAVSQYLSKRTAGGWVTENVSPFGFQANIFVPPFLGFSPDLRFAALSVSEPSLSSECPEGFENLYLREEGTGTLRCLTPEAPQTTNKFGYCFIYGGSSEDGSRVFFKTTVRYAGAPAGSGAQLYEWHEGALSLVSVLPGESEPVAPTPKTSFGMRSEETCQTGLTRMRNAISADGSRAIWTYVPTNPAEPSRLLDRIDGTETVQLDALPPEKQGFGPAGEGVFWAASANGQVVYFTDERQLIFGTKAEEGAPDLYRYDFTKAPNKRLTDLTSGSGKGTVAGDVKGVIGASDDGSVAYFVAGAALTPEAEENEAHQHAEAGKDNLYVFDAATSKTSFIAQLAEEDNRDWETGPKALTARVTPDGGHLAFLSIEAEKLAGYDNLLAATSGKFAGGEHCQLPSPQGEPLNSPLCPQAFLYDKGAASLICASCNPGGSRPLGPSAFPTWTNVYEGPRYLSDDGSRLFFESFDRLLTADQNDKRDVYELELAGSGTCDAANPNYEPARGGCVFLVSTGKSPDESYLVDASATGRDAFLSTRSALSGWDTNENYDVYDYREGGGLPEPEAAPAACDGEGSCKPPAGTPPSPPTPATPTFNGPGNPKPKPAKPRHHKKKHKRHHRKGKSHKKGKGKNGKKRASKTRRAVR